MTQPKRPSPRPLFLEPVRHLSVKFYTSNIDKYLQAKTLFDAYGLSLRYFKSASDPYAESYDRGTAALLTAAIEQIRATIGRSSLFFVEDTSVRIDALSTSTQDVPGLAVKEWFATTPFETLDCTLPSDPFGRRAVVRSDIALHLPGLPDPLFFHGETAGTIAASPPTFQEDPFCPWLTPNTFNGWFVPDGSDRRLGEMDWEESIAYDFRVKALTALLGRLEEYAAMLNAPPDCYTTVREPTESHGQQSLFTNGGQCLIIMGPTCAGKTTFGRIAQTFERAYPVIEASDVLRSLRTRDDSDLPPLEFAQRVLAEQGPDIVARRLAKMYRITNASDVIITGFRTIEELEHMRRVHSNVRIVHVTAAPRTRYARSVRRGRDVAATYGEFQAVDRAQWGFGLLRVAEAFADVRINNEGTLADFDTQVRSVLGNAADRPRVAGVTTDIQPAHRIEVHRAFRCLEILGQSGAIMTCDDISQITATTPTLATVGSERYVGKAITANNVNKILKALPELARRFEAHNETLRYSITDAGRAYLRLMRELYDAHKP